MRKLILVVILAMTMNFVRAYDCCIDGIYYYINEYGAWVTSDNGSVSSYSGSITIPSSISYSGSNHTVVGINWDAFRNCSGLTSVYIPDGVIYIDERAFLGCSSLSSIVVSSGNTVFDSRDNCNAIIITSSNTLYVGCNNSTIPNTVTSIYDYAFYECSSLSSITIPNSVTRIGSQAFYGCSSLSTIIIPNSVSFIQSEAFRGCTSLSSITIPNSVDTIGNYVFSGCTSLTSIAIPNSVTFIGTNVFSNCPLLSSITVDAGNPIYDSRNNCNAIIETGTNTLVVGCNNSSIPNTVTSIGDYAFMYCSGIQSLTIPNGVTSIGNSSFAFCSSLSKVTLSESLTTIEDWAFNNCTSLDSVIIPYSVSFIGTGAFGGSTMLSYLVIPNPSIPVSQTYTIHSGLTLCVPRSLLITYLNMCSRFGSTVIPLGAEVSLTSNDEMMGRGVGSAIYDFKYQQTDSTVRIAASAYTGYRFKQWNDGNTQNPRYISLTKDTTFQAIFEVGSTPGTGDTVFIHDTIYITQYSDTVYLEYDGSAANQYSLEDNGVYYFMGAVVNIDGLYIKLYAADGKLLTTSNTNINMSSYPNGIYIVTDGKGGFLRINHYKNE